MSKATQYLEEFSGVASERFDQVDSLVRTNYEFFQAFFLRENLEKAEWADFQDMKPHLHCFTSMAIAGANALGNPNHELGHYRNSFLHLKFGDGSLEQRLRDCAGDVDYKLKYFGESAWGEIAGYAFPEESIFYNSRVKFATDLLGLEQSFMPGDDLAARLIKTTESIQAVKVEYQNVVGVKTDFPLYIELDQFFSWLYETYANDCKFLPSIFKTRIEANWAFDLLATTLEILGATGPEDKRISLTVPKNYNGKVLRLNFGNWLVMNFRATKELRCLDLNLLSNGVKEEWGIEPVGEPWKYDGPEMYYYQNVSDIGESFSPDIEALFVKTYSEIRNILVPGKVVLGEKLINQISLKPCSIRLSGNRLLTAE